MLQVEDLKIGEEYIAIHRSGKTHELVTVEEITEHSIRMSVQHIDSRMMWSRNTVGPGRMLSIYSLAIGHYLIKIYPVLKLKKVKERLQELRDAGFIVEPRAMGSGGVGQVRTTRDEVRIQVAAGYSKYNSAMCVILFIHKSDRG